MLLSTRDRLTRYTMTSRNPKMKVYSFLPRTRKFVNRVESVISMNLRPSTIRNDSAMTQNSATRTSYPGQATSAV